MPHILPTTRVRDTSSSDPCQGAVVRSTARPSFVTISVDDGAVSDFMTANLLSKFGLKATFYIPRNNPERPVVTESQIKELASTFEVGGHTLSHVALPKVSSRAWQEVKGCKNWLEDLLGRPAVSFCYPRGKYTPRIRALVAKAGFNGARTCRFNLNSLPRDPFAAGVSTHAAHHPVSIQFRHALLESNLQGLMRFMTVNRMATDWEMHFQRALDWVECYGGVAHLYLHSWEIEHRNEWSKLQAVFQRVRDRPELVPITNGELFALVESRSEQQNSRLL